MAMFPTRRAWSFGLLAGSVAALLDIGLIAVVDPAVSAWVLIEAGLFWAGAGWLVVASHTGLPHFRHGIVTTVILNLPWYVLESFAAGHPKHLPPLMLMSVVFGLGFGFARRWVFRGVPSSSLQGVPRAQRGQDA
jgi:hypothetical protein